MAAQSEESALCAMVHRPRVAGSVAASTAAWLRYGFGFGLGSGLALGLGLGLGLGLRLPPG